MKRRDDLADGGDGRGEMRDRLMSVSGGCSGNMSLYLIRVSN